MEDVLFEERDPIPMTVPVRHDQLNAIDLFTATERLDSRDKAIELLLDIAIETVTGTGRRFWDKKRFAGDPLRLNEQA